MQAEQSPSPSRLPHATPASIRPAERLRRIGLWLLLTAVALVLLDYATGWQSDLSPIDHSVHTSPLTLLCLLLGTAALVWQRPLRSPATRERLAWAATLACALSFPISDGIADSVTGWLPNTQPLQGTGWNTAFALSMIAAGQLLHRVLPRLASLLILGAIIPAIVSLNGIILGAPSFHGEMSVTTALGLTGLWLAALRPIARQKPLRLILRDTRSGRLLRKQLLAWLALDVGVLLLLRVFDLTEKEMYPAIHSAQMILTWVLSQWFSLKFAGLLDNARKAQSQLLGEAERDHLTGLATRRAAQRYYQATSLQARAFSVVLLDIDHFKQINDVHGHAAGDAALAALATVIRANLRITDFAARWGGEEFLVILQGAQPVAGVVWAERLRAALTRAGPLTPGLPPLTVSLGVTANLPEDRHPLDFMVRSADEALYAAKADGRDCTWISDPNLGYGLRRASPRPAADRTVTQALSA